MAGEFTPKNYKVEKETINKELAYNVIYYVIL